MNNKKKLPEGIRFGPVDPYQLTANITWDCFRLDTALRNLGLMCTNREYALSEPFSEFRKSEYFTPPTYEETKNMNALYERVAIDFAKYMRDHYK